MITRLEINGFKTFRDFELDLQPFTVIAGTNAAGKSNLFDAIQVLGRLAEHDLRTALSEMRGDADELFHRDADGTASRSMEFAVEVLVRPTVRDPWGEQHEVTQTRLRYELKIERRRDQLDRERFYVAHEAVRPIRASKDDWAQQAKQNSSGAIKNYLKYRRPSDLLSTTEDEEGRPTFKIAQDGHAGRDRPASAAEATVLSSIRTAEFRHLYALRTELLSWRLLQLDPAGLRQPADYHAPEQLAADGANVAAVLARLRAETGDDARPEGMLADLSADLVQLIPDVGGVHVHDNEAERRWELRIVSRSGPEYSGRVASDGTLRLLALLTALSDPSFATVLCFEEPENGVHPARIGPLIDMLRDITVGAFEDTSDDAVSQLVITTHSPVVVARVRSGEGQYFDQVSYVTGGESGISDRVTRARPITVSDSLDDLVVGPAAEVEVGVAVTPAEVREYLGTAVRA